MADENFIENPFYIALSKQFSDLYTKACARKCIICIPIKSSLSVLSRGKSVKHRTLIPKAELGLHILQPSPLQSLEEGLYDCVQNGYSVKIEKPGNGKNGVIRGYSGFARSFSAEILSEVRKAYVPWIDWLIDCLIIGFVFCRSIDWLIYWLIDWLIDCLYRCAYFCVHCFDFGQSPVLRNHFWFLLYVPGEVLWRKKWRIVHLIDDWPSTGRRNGPLRQALANSWLHLWPAQLC